MFSQRYSINASFTVNSSLYIHQCGWENCQPGHSFGPALRDHYLIHCVLRGKGTLKMEGETYPVMKGQGFLIPPGIISTYTADEEDPWYYGWLGFAGPDATRVLSLCGMSCEQPIFVFRAVEEIERCILELIRRYEDGGNTFAAVSGMFALFSLLAEGRPAVASKGEMVDHILDYIEKNYSYGITVSNISNHVNLNRSHLFRVFKEAVGMSPQEYLRHYRLDRAATLLRTTTMNVYEIMLSTGYQNASNFTRQFKEAYGYTPSEYRNRCKVNVAVWDGETSIHFDGQEKPNGCYDHQQSTLLPKHRP